jgi:RNA polymerase sigma factor (sigma-70 family)
VTDLSDGVATVDENDWLARRFEDDRGRLRAVAYRMLGSSSEADDAVQEAWLRLSRVGSDEVRNLGGWLTTVVARVCLDMLRSRDSRREEPLDDHSPDSDADADAEVDPANEALLADSVGLALLVVLDTLSPAERVAFVLHDIFDVPFEEIAPVVDRTPTAARQLASRARRRVRQADSPDADPTRQRRIVDAFLTASRDGDFQALLAMLDPQVVLRADAVAVRMGAPGEVRGAGDVAAAFSGRARAAQPALVDGAAGWVWAVAGQPRGVFAFTIVDEKIVGVDVVADPERLRGMRVTVLEG